jgi:4-hydroxybenzoate polyprenyltransferase
VCRTGPLGPLCLAREGGARGPVPHHGAVPRTIRGLSLACHPLPSAAVTAFAVAFGLAAGLSAGRLALLGTAVLSGQVSIGWLNDLVDREIDRRAERSDKPLATALVTEGAVRTAVATAAVVCVVASLALGLLPGLLHLAAVASAYSYDLRLKSTVVSWLPFAVSFGLLPCVVTTALPTQPFPSILIVLAGAALGVGAHFANTVKDTEADAVTGVRGVPQRIGPFRSLIVAAMAVVVAGVAIVLLSPDAGAWGSALAAGFTAVGSAALAARGHRRLAFPGLVVAAGLVVVGVVLSGATVAG